MWRAAAGRVDALTELRASVRDTRAELISDRFFQASQWREATAELLSVANTTGKLMVNLWKLDPVTGAPTTVAQRLWKWTKEKVEGDVRQQIIDANQTRERLEKIADEEYGLLAADVLLDLASEVHPAFQAAKTVSDLAQDIHSLSELPKNFAELRRTMDEATNNLDRQLDVIEGDLAAAQQRLVVRGGILTAAQWLCDDERGSAPTVQLN